VSTVRISTDGGAVIDVSGVIYTQHAGQPTLGLVTDTPTHTNIAAKTWTYDDSNVNGGSNHITWTAVEMAVCLYGTGNQGGPVTLTNDHTFYNMYTASSAGTVRVYGTWGNGEHYDIAVNGYTILLNLVADEYAHSQAVGVRAGDTVSFSRRGGGSQSAYSLFLPNSYP